MSLQLTIDAVMRQKANREQKMQYVPIEAKVVGYIQNDVYLSKKSIFCI